MVRSELFSFSRSLIIKNILSPSIKYRWAHEIVSHIVEHLTVARIPKIGPISHQSISE